MDAFIADRRPRPPAFLYFALILMWVGTAMGIYDALTQPFTGTVPGFVGRLLGPVGITSLLVGRYAHGRLQRVGVLLGIVLCAASFLLILVGLATRQ
jgi:hypothetical protein